MIEKKFEIIERAHSAKLLILYDEVLHEVKDETTTIGSWAKLESKFFFIKKNSPMNHLRQKDKRSY